MDSSEMAEKALKYALESYPDAEFTVYHIVGALTMMMGEAVGLALADDLEAAAEKQAEVVFEAARDIAAEYDTEIETEVGLGHPVRAILEHAEDYDTIVMGSHGQHSERHYTRLSGRERREGSVPPITHSGDLCPMISDTNSGIAP